MKRIRKAVNNAVIALIAVSVLLCAASCMVPVGENYELHTEEDTVTEIVIYDRSGSRSDDLPYNSAGENEEPVAVVAAEKFEEFCTEFKKITEFKAKMIIAPGAWDPRFDLYGIFAKISYESGAVEYVSDGVQYYYYPDGTYECSHCSCAKDSEWDDFINKFLPEQ